MTPSIWLVPTANWVLSYSKLASTPTVKKISSKYRYQGQLPIFFLHWSTKNKYTDKKISAILSLLSIAHYSDYAVHTHLSAYESKSPCTATKYKWELADLCKASWYNPAHCTRWPWQEEVQYTHTDNILKKEKVLDIIIQGSHRPEKVMKIEKKFQVMKKSWKFGMVMKK